MAGSYRCFMKLNLGLLSNHVTRRIVLNQSRTLFNENSLGMVAYKAVRDGYKNQFLNLEDSFREKMQNYVNNEASGMIFTEDLKVMLHLAEKTPEDLELLLKMLKQFNGQSESMRFTTFLFGPIVMRSLYRLNEPQLAMELFKDPSMGNFFNQLATYQILMDLLYSNKLYKEMLEIYDNIRTRLTDGRVHPRNSLILVTAACYKENTPESLEYGLKLWRDLNERGYPMIRRVLTYLAALAINQGKADVALEILTTARKPRYIAIRCLRMMAFCEINRTDDIIPFFRHSLERDDPSGKKETYFKDTIEKVEETIERAGLSPDAEIRKLVKLIKDNGHVQDTNLEDHLNEEIKVVPRTFTGQSDDRQPGNYRTGYSNSRYSQSEESRPRVIRRPGLRDLV